MHCYKRKSIYQAYMEVVLFHSELWEIFPRNCFPGADCTIAISLIRAPGNFPMHIWTRNQKLEKDWTLCPLPTTCCLNPLSCVNTSYLRDICMYIYCKYIDKHISIYTYIFIYVYINILLYTVHICSVHIHIHTYTHYPYIYNYIYTYILIYIYVHILHTHVYIHI